MSSPVMRPTSSIDFIWSNGLFVSLDLNLQMFVISRMWDLWKNIPNVFGRKITHNLYFSKPFALFEYLAIVKHRLSK
jgi:hypothetical protein